MGTSAYVRARHPVRPRALLLDALGTLVELRPPAPLLQRELARRFGIELSTSQAQHAIAAEIAYYRAHLDEGRDPESLAVLHHRCAQALCVALPPSAALARVEADMLTQALLASLRFRAFADAPPAILAARGRGERVVVASNWDVSLRDVLARVGLAPLLDGIVTSAHAGTRKPAPEVFEQALRAAGAAPLDAYHVGDSVREDVDGARGAGIEPILLSRDRAPGPPGVRTIATLSELGAGP